MSSTEGMTELRLRADDLAWVQIDDEVVALEARASRYLAANPAGTLLWRALADGSTRDQLATRLVDVFGIDRAVAIADTDRFIDHLVAEGLLETVP